MVRGHWHRLDEIVSIDGDGFADRQRVSYRFHGHNADGPFVVEQQAYYAEATVVSTTCGSSAQDSARAERGFGRKFGGECSLSRTRRVVIDATNVLSPKAGSVTNIGRVFQGTCFQVLIAEPGGDQARPPETSNEAASAGVLVFDQGASWTVPHGSTRKYRAGMNQRLNRIIFGDRGHSRRNRLRDDHRDVSPRGRGDSYDYHLWRLLVLVGGSVVVLWLAHVYAHGLGESLKIGHRLTIAELSSIARREYAVVAAAILPLAAVGLGAAGALEDRTAVQLALWLGVATLTGQAVRYAHLESLSRSATLVTVTVNLAIGLAIIALEVLIAH